MPSVEKAKLKSRDAAAADLCAQNQGVSKIIKLVDEDCARHGEGNRERQL